MSTSFYIQPYDSGGYGWVLWHHVGCPCIHPSFHQSICLSIRLYFRFRTITSKCPWIFTKLSVCINIVEIWYEIANGQISSIFDCYLPLTCPYFHSWMITVNINGFSPLWRSGPSCSKLRMSLVNDSLKFTLSDTQICWNFLLKKCE